MYYQNQHDGPELESPPASASGTPANGLNTDTAPMVDAPSGSSAASESASNNNGGGGGEV